MTVKNKKDHEKATECLFCRQPFTSVLYKVADHDHISGEYRGTLCNDCNLKYPTPNFIPVILHNGSRYDNHLFVKSLCLKKYPGEVSVIPHTDEIYISLSKEIFVGKKKFYLRFLDSFRFLPSSLDKLAQTLTPEQFITTKEHFDVKYHSLILRKGVFPYDHLDSFERYEETELPPKESFYSKLYETAVTNQEYQHAQEVWKSFHIKNLGEYSDLYLKTDVFLLCDIFEVFRFTCQDQYKLDPAHFYTSPGLSWSAMLKLTQVKLHLLMDYDMILFTENGIRGGISQVSHRYGEANNKYMGTFNKEKPSSYLTYLDVNNLYGWSMCQPLPEKDFEWVSDVYNINLNTIPKGTGYFFEVDLEYPESLHQDHNNIPLAPFSEIVKAEWTSSYLHPNYKPFNCKKLLTTLYHKEKYIIHHETLKLYLDLGLKLVKIHRALKFTESPWLKTYIDLNTKFRQDAKDDFGKSFFKLMNNSVFGKMMENVHNHQNIILCVTWEKARKQIAKPNFKYSTIFSEDLVAIHLAREKIELNKPIYVGMSILDLSKLNIYKFHYQVMVPKYKEKLLLLYHDTDSFIYQIYCDDFYEDLKDAVFNQHFDTSNFSKQNPFNIVPNNNKMVLGKMKDENGGQIMTHFIGLRSKMYATKVQNQPTVKKIKGVKKHIIKNKISFEDYMECLEKKEPQQKSLLLIQSRKHEVTTTKMIKKTLCPLDDKKYIMEDGITCISYGHFKIN